MEEVMKEYRGKTWPGSEDKAVQVFAVEWNGSNEKDVVSLGDECSGVVTNGSLIIRDASGVLATLKPHDYLLKSKNGGLVYADDHVHFISNYIPVG
jgi:hypothetical protein